MTLDLGDEALAGSALTGTFPMNSTGSAGDAVTWDATNDRFTQTSAANETVYGVLAGPAPATAGDPAPVHIGGVLVAAVGTGVVQGDILVTTATAGELDTSAGVNARTITIDEGGTTVHGEFAPVHPWAASDTAGTNPFNESESAPAGGAIVRLL